jgi:hypothetical protein
MKNILKIAEDILKKSKELEHNAFIQNRKILISELHPNEAEFIAEKLQKAGIDAKYSYAKGIYYQYVTIDKGSISLLNEVKKILSKTKTANLKTARTDDMILIRKKVEGDDKTLVDYELYTGASAPSKFFYMIPLPNKDTWKFEDELKDAVKKIFDKYKNIFPK